MKFMVTWQITQDKWIPVLKVWSGLTAAERADAGEGVKIVGRWHNTAGRGGVAIMEASDAAKLYRYLGKWNPYMDMQVAPVLEDEESAVLAKTTLADHGA
jgi:hypothetical protein